MARSPRLRLCVALATALAVAGGIRAGADEDLRRLKVMELEADLARQSDIYLYLDPPAHRLAVKVRGLELASFELKEVSRLVFQPLLGAAEAPPLPAPAIWTVVEGPGDTDRETIAPTTLRPYSEEEEREEPGPAIENKDEAAAERARTEYRIRLDIGWQLFVSDEAPQLGLARRLVAAVRDGWQRVRGEEPAHPPLVTLVVSPEDARMLHHLFRAGTQILVAPIE